MPEEKASWKLHKDTAGSTLENSSCIVTYFPSHKTFKTNKICLASKDKAISNIFE